MYLYIFFGGEGGQNFTNTKFWSVLYINGKLLWFNCLKNVHYIVALQNNEHTLAVFVKDCCKKLLRRTGIMPIINVKNRKQNKKNGDIPTNRATLHSIVCIINNGLVNSNSKRYRFQPKVLGSGRRNFVTEWSKLLPAF